MKLPITWLKDYVTVPDNLTALTDRLTSIGYMQDHPPTTVAGSVVLDLEVRQNRSDCLSLIGLSRETAAAFGSVLVEPKFNVQLPKVKNGVTINITEPKLCYRFNTISFEGITVRESPQWLKDRLEAYGIKTINNIVDITNFVMVEYGEPLHVFDLKTISQKTLAIRLAKKGESIIILGGKRIDLTTEDLVIADANEIRAIAGIVGGLHEAVNGQTTSILLEAATYNQATIRRTSIRHSIRTEASLRHEKFLDARLSDVALARAYGLIIDLCGGKIIARTDSYVKPFLDKTITMNVQTIEKLGGLVVTEKKCLQILKSLGIKAQLTSANIISATIPYFRTDIEQEVDLVEEILRIYGYDKIPEHMPSTPVPQDIQSKAYVLEEKIRDILIGCGLTEEITEPLANEKSPSRKPIILENSLNSEKTMLRTTLQNGLMYALDVHHKYKKQDVALFEIGKIYYRKETAYVEERVVGLLISGVNESVRTAKGVAELLIERLGKCYTDLFVTVLDMGLLVPTYYIQISVDQLLTIKDYASIRVHTTPPQIIYEDISLVVPVTTAVGMLIDSVRSVSSLIYSVELGEDPRLLDDQTEKSVFIKLRFYSESKPLKASDIEPVRIKILKKLKQEFKAHLR